jgi:hypothetical protein
MKLLMGAIHPLNEFRGFLTPSSAMDAFPEDLLDPLLGGFLSEFCEKLDDTPMRDYPVFREELSKKPHISLGVG